MIFKDISNFKKLKQGDSITENKYIKWQTIIDVSAYKKS